MKVASLSVIAQFPQVLDLHVRNLRWALAGSDHHIYVFTFANWNFDKARYPDVTFLETPVEDPYDHHHFWRCEIPAFLGSEVKEDMLSFTEADMFYYRPLLPLIQESQPHITMNDDLYHGGLKDNGVEVYPRLWEGGLILNSQIMREAVEAGVSLGPMLCSPEILRRIRALPDHFTVWDQPINRWDEAKATDTLMEFTLHCYFRQMPVRRASFTTHFHPVERVLYFNRDKLPAVLTYDLIKTFVWQEHIHRFLFMTYLVGETPYDDGMVSHFVKEDWYWYRRQIELLALHAEEWMPPEAYKRFRHVCSLLEPARRIKLA